VLPASRKRFRPGSLCRDLHTRRWEDIGEAFTVGLEAHELDGINVRVYGAAKTVADCFKYRNKLGLDVAIEALKLYLREKGGGPDELMRFARVCRVEKVMRPYIEALL